MQLVIRSFLQLNSHDNYDRTDGRDYCLISCIIVFFVSYLVLSTTGLLIKVAPYCFLKSGGKENFNFRKYHQYFEKRMKLKLYIEKLSEHQIVLIVKCVICCYDNSDVSKWRRINI